MSKTSRSTFEHTNAPFGPTCPLLPLSRFEWERAGVRAFSIYSNPFAYLCFVIFCPHPDLLPQEKVQFRTRSQTERHRKFDRSSNYGRKPQVPFALPLPLRAGEGRGEGVFMIFTSPDPSILPSAIPTGLQHSAQGCEEQATLGPAFQHLALKGQNKPAPSERKQKINMEKYNQFNLDA